MKRGQIVWWTWTLIGAFTVFVFLTAFSTPLFNVMNQSISDNGLDAGVAGASGLVVPALFIFFFIGVGMLMIVRK